jgi:hypothetical protein
MKKRTFQEACFDRDGDTILGAIAGILFEFAVEGGFANA